MKTREDILSLTDCPFCGLEPMLLETREVGGSAQQFMIACYQCGIEMGSEDREDLVETWSRRAAPTPPAAEAPGQEPVALTELLGKALTALDTYADPTGYTDSNGEQLGAKAEVHQGLLAKFVAAEIRAALSAPPTYADAEAKGFARAIEAATEAQPSTAEDPTESAYQKGRFDGIMEYATAIRSLASPAPKGET